MINGKNGFTIIELLLVIVLIAGLSAVVIPRVNLGPARLSLAARKLQSDLRYARNLSSTRKVVHGIKFQAASYTLFENNDSTDPALDPAYGRDYTVDMAEEFGDVAISWSAGLADGIVRFGSKGEAMDDSDNVFGQESVTLTSDSETIVLSINGSTGYVIAD